MTRAEMEEMLRAIVRRLGGTRLAADRRIDKTACTVYGKPGRVINDAKEAPSAWRRPGRLGAAARQAHSAAALARPVTPSLA